MALIRRLLPFVLVFAGVALVSHGVGMIYEPAQIILLGVSLVAVGFVVDWERGA
jgi:hypothetical protein